MRSDCTRFSQYLTTLYVFTFGTAQQYAYVVACLTFVQQFAEHFNTGTSGFLSFFQTYDFDLVTNVDDTALYTTGYYCTTTGNREYVFDRQQERFVHGTLGSRDVAVQCGSQFEDFLFISGIAFQGFQCRTLYNRAVVAGEVVAGQQVADFHFNQFQQLGIVDHVAFVHEHDDVRYAYLTGQQDVFAGLRHRAVGCGTYQDCTVHLCGAGNHVFNVVGVPRAVYVCVVAGFGFVFHVRGVNGNTACFFFGCVVDLVVSFCSTTEFFSQNSSQSGSQGGFTMVNVTDGANVYVRFATFEFFLSHELIPLH
ncbi:Uncharacterised protein [Neisseria meningitidis]|nr:Uncharacterised protein [Neisseria meningitidis]CWO63388.1 Uncharacterised protein [Neisseria meningitidis]CWT44249.1 Uncharacterised protein [Neisseria meningitidis]